MRRLLLALVLFVPQPAEDVRDVLKSLVSTPAVTGHEERLAAQVAERLRQRGLTPKIDSMSNVTVTIGTGRPHRLLIANIDEPGYVVSGITGDGYLRIQRVGTAKPHLYFDQYFEGQRLSITTANSKTIPAVSSIPSTHLARGLDRTERPFVLSDAYIDAGAKSAKDVSGLGIRLLDPISIEKNFTTLAQDRVSGPFLSDRAGAAVLLSILTTTPASEIKGAVTAAFTTQEHFGRKGLDRMSAQFEPEEVFIIEPLDDSQADQLILIDTQAAPTFRRILTRYEGMVREATLKPQTGTSSWKKGTEVIRVAIPIMFYATPVEVLDLKHLQSTIRFLRAIVQSGVS